MPLYSYYLKRTFNNQTCRITERVWNLLGFDSNILELTPDQVISSFGKKRGISVSKAFDHTAFIKFPVGATLIYESTIFEVYKRESKRQYLPKQLQQISLLEKIEILKKDTEGYYFCYCTKGELLNILSFLNAEQPINSHTKDLINKLRSVFKQPPLSEKYESDSDSEAEKLDKIPSTLPVPLSTKSASSSESNTPTDLDKTVVEFPLAKPSEISREVTVEPKPISAQSKLLENKPVKLITTMAINAIRTPQTFSGNLTEDADRFFVNFERVATANRWDDAEKLIMLPLSLCDTAQTVFEAIESENPNLNWHEAKNTMIKFYNSDARLRMRRQNLESRRKSDSETVKEYLLKIKEECRRIDKNMAERE
ncbi:uncharacterized protein LOC126909905, partial [Daktulosphaira vitifoliae]|uniref:uncharacterized protein LOC126909905 n=1 Tax=Daktulosphaira vitifoliae TaxID=58002 RepID=UPI0021A9BE8E